MVGPLLETLPVNKLWGIGSHTAEKLRTMGITTCGELGRTPLPFLLKKFGVIGERLKAMGNGKLETPLEVEASEPKSIGHSMTLAKDIWQRDDITPCLLRLSERVGGRARRYGYKGKTVTLTVRYADFKTFTRQATLPSSTNDTGEIYRCTVAILDGIRLRNSIRLLGVSLSSLGKDDNQMSLFQDTEREKSVARAKAMDAVNDKFGEHSITFASTLGEQKDHKVISPAWRPRGVRKSDV
jgi:DNA polymerase-4